MKVNLSFACIHGMQFAQRNNSQLITTNKFTQSRMKNTNAFSYAGRKKQRAVILKNKRRNHPLPASVSSLGNLFSELPLASMKVSVIVPARDESEHILSALEALRMQCDAQGQKLPYDVYEVLLLTNNCSDNTYSLAIAYQKQHPQFQLHIANIQLEKKDAHIGTVRRLLMDEAFRRHQYKGNDGLILSTDSDTQVDAVWIYNTMQEMGEGCDALGGRILTRNEKDDNKVYYLLDTTYRCLAAKLEAVMNQKEDSEDISHFQYFGASLAVRCSAYQRAGRLPAISCLEDEAFSRALHRVDVRIKKSSAVKVYTSARLHGRVQMGLSKHLAHLGHLQKENVVLYVESLPTLMEKYRIKQHLYTAWMHRRKGYTSVPSILQVKLLTGIPRSWLIKEMCRCIYFGEYWEKAEAAMYAGKWKQRQEPVAITEAISDLRRHLKDEDEISA